METINIEVKYPYKGSVKDRILDSLKVAFSALLCFAVSIYLAVDFAPIAVNDDAYDPGDFQSRPLSILFTVIAIVCLFAIFIAPFFKRENKGIKSFDMTLNPVYTKYANIRITKKNGKTIDEKFMIQSISNEKRYYRFKGIKEQYVIPKKVLSNDLEQKLYSYIELFNKSKEPNESKPKDENNNDDNNAKDKE